MLGLCANPIVCNLWFSHTTSLNLKFLSYEGLRMTSISTVVCKGP